MTISYISFAFSRYNNFESTKYSKKKIIFNPKMSLRPIKQGGSQSHNPLFSTSKAHLLIRSSFWRSATSISRITGNHLLHTGYVRINLWGLRHHSNVDVPTLYPFCFTSSPPHAATWSQPPCTSGLYLESDTLYPLEQKSF